MRTKRLLIGLFFLILTVFGVYFYNLNSEYLIYFWLLQLIFIEYNTKNQPTFKVLFEIDEILLRTNNKNDLFNRLVKLIYSEFNVSTCWIGVLKNGEITPTFICGNGQEYLKRTRINSTLVFENNPILPKKELNKYKWKKSHFEHLILDLNLEILLVIHSNDINQHHYNILKTIATKVKFFFKRHSEKRLYYSLFEKSEYAIFITDINNNIIDVNKKFEHVTGYSKNEVINKNPRILNSGVHEKEFYKKLWSQVNRIGYWNGKIYNRKKNGELFIENVSISNIYDEDGEIINRFAVFCDITNEEILINQQYIHNTTKLYNKLYIDANFKKITNNHKLVCFIYIDVYEPKFKLGYKNEYDLLLLICERLTSTHKEDIICYLESFNFLLISPIKNINTIDLICKRLINILSQTYYINNLDLILKISLNIGVSIFNKDGVEVNELLDKAIFSSSKGSTNSYSLFNNEVFLETQKNIKINLALQKAIENNELRVVYHPVLNVKTNKIHALKAELTWKTNLDNYDFLNSANELGLILKFEDFLFSNIFTDIQKFKKFIPDIKVYIPQLHKHINFHCIYQYNKDYNFIYIYIDHWVNDIEFEELSKTIINLNIGLIFDAINTGNGNKIFLKKGYGNKIRINKKITKDINLLKDNLIIAESIIKLAGNLNIETLADEVSSSEEYDILKEIGCDFIAGSYISNPLSNKEVIDFFNKFI